MFSKKLKCNVSNSMKVEFPFIQMVNLEDTIVVKCTVCSSILWRTSITDHIQAKKNKNALLAKSQSGCMTNYFRKLEPSKGDYDLTLYEGTYAYHSVLNICCMILCCALCCYFVCHLCCPLCCCYHYISQRVQQFPCKYRHLMMADTSRNM
jgi:hypothetical protein